MLLRYLLASLVLLPGLAFPQAEYKVYTEHPRLWLEPERVQRLRKDVERQSARWQSLRKLLDEKASLPEEPLVDALLFQVIDDREAGQRALEWALARASSSDLAMPQQLRLAAIVYDWCGPLVNDDERSRLTAALGQAAAAVAQRPSPGIEAVRSALMAAVAVSNEWDRAALVSTELMNEHWKKEILPSLRRGELWQRNGDFVALLEICHLSRYNFDLDLWGQAPEVFRELPYVRMLGYYPQPFESREGLFHRPALPTAVEADVVMESSLGRIGELLLVNYDNAREPYQFLQGWLRNDPYTLTTPFGAPYEFIWLNPYLPGLPFHSAPLVTHDKAGGRVFARKGWQQDDVWVGYLEGQLQLFADGQLQVIERDVKQAPLLFSGAAIVLSRVPMKFKVKVPDGKAIYLVGLGQGQTYSIKVNRRSFQLYEAGPGGIVVLETHPEEKGGTIKFDAPVKVRIRPAPQGAPTLGGKR